MSSFKNQMTRTLRDGNLKNILKSNPKVLIVVDFGNPHCPPCKSIKPWFDLLPEKYPKVCQFYHIECDSCPDDARLHQIRATPTFVFFMNNAEITRVVGADRAKITQEIEAHKPLGPFAGAARTLSEAPTSDFLSNIPRKQAPAQVPPPAPAPAPRAPPAFDPLAFLTKPKTEEADQVVTPEVPVQAPKKALSVAAEAMKNQLLDFGFDEEIILQAMSAVGSDSIDRILDCIERIQSGEPVQQMERVIAPIPQMSREEIDRQTSEMRAKAAAKKAEQEAARPKVDAANELKRRKEVLEQLEAKKKLDATKKELDMKMAEKDRIKEKLEREKVRQRIAAQRASNAPKEVQPKAVQQVAEKKAGECTLKMNLSNGRSSVMKFPAETTTFSVVDAQLRTEHPDCVIVRYEMTFPRKLISGEDMYCTLAELNLTGRAMINVIVAQ